MDTALLLESWVACGSWPRGSSELVIPGVPRGSPEQGKAAGEVWPVPPFGLYLLGMDAFLSAQFPIGKQRGLLLRTQLKYIILLLYYEHLLFIAHCTPVLSAARDSPCCLWGSGLGACSNPSAGAHVKGGFARWHLGSIPGSFFSLLGSLQALRRCSWSATLTPGWGRKRQSWMGFCHFQASWAPGWEHRPRRQLQSTRPASPISSNRCGGILNSKQSQRSLGWARGSPAYPRFRSVLCLLPELHVSVPLDSPSPGPASSRHVLDCSSPPAQSLALLPRGIPLARVGILKLAVARTPASRPLCRGRALQAQGWWRSIWDEVVVHRRSPFLRAHLLFFTYLFFLTQKL